MKFSFGIFLSSLTFASRLVAALDIHYDYDYIVVGAGSAGSIVASKLAQNGDSVLLLEEGGDNTDPAIDNMKQYFNVAFNTFNYGFLHNDFITTDQTVSGSDESRSFTIPRGRGLGGTFNINAAAFVPGNKVDFDFIADVTGDQSWTYKNIIKYLSELEQTLGIVKYGISNQAGAAEHVESAMRVLGFKYNPDCQRGNQNGICDSFWVGSVGKNGGIRKTSYNGFVEPLLGDDKYKLDVLTFHQVGKLLFDTEDPTKVTGVSTTNLRTNLPAEFLVAKEVILSAGVFQTPHLLLLSGIGPASQLEEFGIDVRVPLEGVGKNLRDHFGFGTFWQLKDLQLEAPYLFHSPTLNMFGPEQKGPTTYQFEISGGYISVVPLRAESVGQVTLASNDPADNLIVNPRAVSTQKDFDALVVALTDYVLPLAYDLEKKGLISRTSLSPNATLEEIQAFVRANVNTNHHAVGTCKVGAANDGEAVIDKDFKVYHTKNLRVIDGSIFPFSPSSNPNALVMAAALLGVNKVIKDDKPSSNRGNGLRNRGKRTRA